MSVSTSGLPFPIRPFAFAASLVLTGVQSGAPSGLIEGDRVEPPHGFVELCARRPELCALERQAADLVPLREAMRKLYGDAALSPTQVTLTHARWRQLSRVGNTVNATLRPTTDGDQERWRLTSDAGDCEEFVLAKRALLMQLGWPEQALRITVVDTGSEYHVVLVVETDDGAYMLDSLTDQIMPVADSSYRFLAAQSVLRPGEWVLVDRAPDAPPTDLSAISYLSPFTDFSEAP